MTSQLSRVMKQNKTRTYPAAESMFWLQGAGRAFSGDLKSHHCPIRHRRRLRSHHGHHYPRCLPFFRMVQLPIVEIYLPIGIAKLESATRI